MEIGDGAKLVWTRRGDSNVFDVRETKPDRYAAQWVGRIFGAAAPANPA